MSAVIVNDYIMFSANRNLRRGRHVAGGPTKTSQKKRVRFCPKTPQVFLTDMALSQQEKNDYFYSKKELALIYQELLDRFSHAKDNKPSTNCNNRAKTQGRKDTEAPTGATTETSSDSQLAIRGPFSEEEDL
eukprot:CAMPEP_0116847716 /NCGR_PEP_ID=MMETSP0418-20121206/14586_1 /TAXON_ID=1158023 /ORGANISM="Astrosyne radiata, Strain 13vi08-1A" /LENGTH=131 /DNA_ID=CAMNT_0004479187 /DNA_START=62 /DNA_END=458 /DNA_ORIENTATION=+